MIWQVWDELERYNDNSNVFHISKLFAGWLLIEWKDSLVNCRKLWGHKCKMSACIFSTFILICILILICELYCNPVYYTPSHDPKVPCTFRICLYLVKYICWHIILVSTDWNVWSKCWLVESTHSYSQHVWASYCIGDFN